MSNHNGYRGTFLIMEDDEHDAAIIQKYLENYRFLCFMARSYDEALGKLSRIKPERLNGVIVDLRMTKGGDDEEGNYFLDHLKSRESYAHVRKIVITVYPKIKPRKSSDAIIIKPVEWEGEDLTKFNVQLRHELDKAIKPPPDKKPDPSAEALKPEKATKAEAPKPEKATKKVPNWMRIAMFIIALLTLIVAAIDYFSNSF